MKIIGVIPARYGSTRFPGKPLADICGKPMIWWVYNQIKKVSEIDEVYVATDDDRIAKVCQENSMHYVMTASDHKTSTERLHEVSHKVQADYYICINGDEPLIDPDVVRAIIPKEPSCTKQGMYVANLMTEILDPVEVVDSSNIKVVTDKDSNALFMSRSPIPYPKASMNYQYFKHVGVLIYTSKALDFFAETNKEKNELVEDVNELRFIEHGVALKMIPVKGRTLSVDTPKDLEKVRSIMQKRIDSGEILL